MDVHDGPGSDGTHTRWEPPGSQEHGAAADAPGYDGGGLDAGGSAEPDAADTSATDVGYDDGGPDAEGSTTMTVEVEGQTRQLPAEHDYTGDGRPDAAVETADGKVIVFADTEDNATGAAGPDGKADEAYIVDKQTGRVVGAAHIDPGSGTWVKGTEPDGPSAAGTDPQTGQIVDVAHVDPRTGEGEEGPAPEAGSTADAGDPTGTGTTTGTGTAGTAGTAGTSGAMTVDLGGRTRQLPAERDYTGDGRADAAVETKDGQVIVFSDTENNDTGAAGPDGRADEAWIVDKSTGKVVGAAHVDPRTGEWVDGVGTDGSSSMPAGSGGEASS